MLAKFKGAFINAVGNFEAPHGGLGFIPSVTTSSSASGSNSFDKPSGTHSKSQQQQFGVPGSAKFPYQRPSFLQLESEDEIQVTADHVIRPIIVPRDISQLPWNTGYAECINAGKSLRNEDQAAVHRGTLHSLISAESIGSKLAEMMPISFSRPLPPQPPTTTTAIATMSSTTTIANGTESASTINGSEKPSATTDETQVNGSTNDQSESQTSKPVIDLQSPSEPLPITSLAPSQSANDLSSNIPTPAPISITLPGIVQGLHEESLPWTYFGLFDGHAGSSVAVAASILLHRLIQEKLESIADLLITFGLDANSNASANCGTNVEAQSDCNADTVESELTNKNDSNKGKVVCCHCNSSKSDSIIFKNANYINETCIINHFNQRMDLLTLAVEKQVTVDSLIIGALESTFWEMDNQIGLDKRIYKMPGGCTALVALFILGKVYIANAGDSRAILVKSDEIIPMSFDFTPESERERVKYLGLLRPELLGSDFTHLEFVRRPMRKDLGKKLLCRDAYMSGWSYKTVTPSDLKFPLVYGEGKRSRVLATIGVTRGFGDHELKAQASSVDIKPFLTPQPQVQVYDLQSEQLTDSDVLIMGTDGLWDVTSNETATSVVQSALSHFPASDITRYKYRYISAAQDLVMSSRGKQKSKARVWRTADNKQATIDDISVFVIPLLPYKEEWTKWKEARTIVKSAASAVSLKDQIFQSLEGTS